MSTFYTFQVDCHHFSVPSGNSYGSLFFVVSAAQVSATSANNKCEVGLQNQWKTDEIQKFWWFVLRNLVWMCQQLIFSPCATARVLCTWADLDFKQSQTDTKKRVDFAPHCCIVRKERFIPFYTDDMMMFGEKILLFTVAVDMISTAGEDLEKPVARHLVLSVSFILIWFRYKADSTRTHRSGGMKRKCDTSLMWWSEPRADVAAGWLFFCSWVSMVVPPFLFKLHFEEKNIYIVEWHFFCLTW